MNSDADFSRNFGTVAIVGTGLMGGSIGMALRSRCLAEHVVGVGRNPARMEKAVELGAVDTFTTDLRTGVAAANLVILCTTIGNILEIIPTIIPMRKSGAVMTDVGSTKTAIAASAAGCSFFVGGHPMTGSEKDGVEAATPTLYQGATWAITPVENTDETAFRIVGDLVSELGAVSLIVSPEIHDAMVAITSHLPHVIASSVMRQAAHSRSALPKITHLSAGSFADMTRVSASPPSIWRDVCLTNRDAVLKAIRDFKVEIEALESAIADSDGPRIESLFQAGSDSKKEWKKT